MENRAGDRHRTWTTRDAPWMHFEFSYTYCSRHLKESVNFGSDPTSWKAIMYAVHTETVHSGTYTVEHTKPKKHAKESFLSVPYTVNIEEVKKNILGPARGRRGFSKPLHTAWSKLTYPWQPSLAPAYRRCCF